MYIKKLYIRLIIVLLVVLNVNTVTGQQYHFVRYSIEEGLLRPGIYDLLEDNYGFLWAALEEGGLARFDGREFQHYGKSHGLPSSTIRCLYQDEKDNVWIGTANKGIWIFNGTEFIPLKGVPELNRCQIRDITSNSKGQFFIGTLNNGLFIINEPDKSLTSLGYQTINTHNGLPNKRVRALITDKNDRVWIGTDSGICLYSDSLQEISLGKNRKILCFYEDTEQNIWVGTQNGALHFTETGIEKIENGLISNRIRAITQDATGSIWFGTNQGISKLTGSKISHYTEHNGLSNDRVRSLLKDRNNNVWIGTYFGGICRYSSDDFSSFGKNDGLLSEQVLSVMPVSEDEVWLGTMEGVFVLKDQNGHSSISSLPNYNLLLAYPIYAMDTDKYGRKWVGTNVGIAILHGGYPNFITDINGLADHAINNILIDNNTVWTATENGVTGFEFTDFERLSDYHTIAFSANQNNNVSSICKDFTGRIWFGFKEGTLAYYDGACFTTLENAPNNIRSMITDANDNLWVGSEDGLFVCEKSSLKTESLAFFKPKSSNPLEKDIHALILDNKQNLWFSGLNGVYALTIDTGFQITSIKQYNGKTGFSGLQTNFNAIAKNSKGQLWFGTIKGLVRIVPDILVKKYLPPPIYLTSIDLNYPDSYAWSNTKLPESFSFNEIPDKLELPYSKSKITFSFIGLNYSYPKNTSYMWKLKGFDKYWTGPIEQSNVSYTNLPDGNYEFIVTAINENDLSSKQPASIVLIIKPPYWKRWWFVVLCLATAVALGYILLQLRMQQLKRINKLLEGKVKKRTLQLDRERENVMRQNEEILQQQEEIKSQRDVLFSKNEEMEEKNREITDSIQYALLIQNAILPSQIEIQAAFRKSFILFKPKDIVSGDFYWFLETTDYKYIAAADCTGHGVPGAFMSIVSHSILEKVVSYTPNDSLNNILEKLSTDLSYMLTKNADNRYRLNDGLDLALCRFPKNENVLEFAGAYRPLYLVRNQSPEQIHILKGARRSIRNDALIKPKPFIEHQVAFNKGDRMYIFSDGYPDQFGGTRERKYMTKRLQSFLVSIQNKPIDEQRGKLVSELKRWQGGYDQVDDIIVIGIEC